MPPSVGDARQRDIRSRFRNPDQDPRGLYFLTDVTRRGEGAALRYAVNGVTPRAGRAWRFSFERMIQLERDGRLVFGRTGFPRLKRFLSEVEDLTSAPSTPEAKPTPEEAILFPVDLIIKETMARLVRALAENPGLLVSLEWRDLERVLGEVFEGLGFDTTVTKASGDGGYDIELSCFSGGRSRRFLVELKHWMGSGQRPSSRIVSAFLDVVAREVGAERGLLISTSGFTAPVLARREIRYEKVALGGPEKVIAFCEQYVRTESGVYVPNPELLPELLFAGTS